MSATPVALPGCDGGSARKADKLVDKFRAKAEALADEVEPTEFRELLYYLVDTVLEKPELPTRGVTQFVELGR